MQQEHEDPIYVFVTGTRDIALADANVDTIRQAMRSVAPRSYEATLIHGGCVGVDITAAYIAKRDLCWEGTVEVPAKWKTHGNKAGPMRNRTLRDMCRLLARAGYRVRWLAFPGPASRGTHDMIRLVHGDCWDIDVITLGK